MVAFRERTRRSVSCVIWTANATALMIHLIVRDSSINIGIAALACAVLAGVWKEA